MNDPSASRPEPSPENWDLLHAAENEPDDRPALGEERIEPGTLVAAAWGDLVAGVAVVTAALAAVLASGRPVNLAALPWAAVLAVTWWSAAASVLLVVRRATPGMLMAGVALARAPRGGALAAALAAGLLGAATLGVAAWPLGGRPLIARVTGSKLEQCGGVGLE